MAIRLNNLAGLLEATNRLAEAEPLYRRALAIDEQSFGPEHPNVATGLMNLAGLLEATNRLAEAEPLFRRAAVIFIRSLGPSHPSAITVTRNYRILLQNQNATQLRLVELISSLYEEAGVDPRKLEEHLQ